jgi:formylglycine-generating enzyme required for sulfatase activity
MKSHKFFRFKSLFTLTMIAFCIAAPMQNIRGTTEANANGLSISGRVTNGSGNGIGGVTIRAVLDEFSVFLPLIVNSNSGGSTSTPLNPPNAGQNFYTVQSDVNGYYDLGTLPGGRYLVTADKEGLDFAPLSYTVITTSGGGNYDFQVADIPTVYSPLANPLSQVTTSSLISVSGDGSTYTFSSETPELAQVDVNEIIIGGISAVAPDGFLRKVISKQLDGSNVVLVTEPASLVDAFESLSINTTQQLTPANIKAISDTPGIKLLQQTKSGDFEFAMNNAVVYDQDGNLSTTQDQIVANGILNVNPTIECRIRIENYELKEFYFTADSSVQTGFTVSSKISLSIPLYEHNLAPTIPLGAIPVGPLVLTPAIDLIAGITGNVHAGVSASVTNTSSFIAGLWHVNGQTLNLSKFESNFSFSPPSFTYGVSFKAYIGPKISAKIYGAVGAYVKPGFGLGLDITPSSNPWLTLKGGFEVSVGAEVTIPIIDKKLLNIRLLAINRWWLLYSLSNSVNNQPYPPTNPSPPQNATDQSLSTQLSWTGGDPDGDLVVYDVYFNAGISSPTSKVADHQSNTTFNPGTLAANTSYTWKVVAFDQHGLSTVGPIWDFTTATGGVTPSEMELVPAGEFQMGCDSTNNPVYGCQSWELPLHTVYLDAYYIDKYPATNIQYQTCVEDGVCAPPNPTSSYTRPTYYGNPAYDDYPVINISWYDAVDYCTWLGKRLPTEAEWEKAARGGSDTRVFPWGDVAPDCSRLNYIHVDFCIGDTSQVGNYPTGASPYGVMDMSGNVWEWVNDWYQEDYYSISLPNNPTGPESGTYKVIRGGSYNETEWYNRVAMRELNYPNVRTRTGGVRCALSVP